MNSILSAKTQVQFYMHLLLLRVTESRGGGSEEETISESRKGDS
jgi:hypothetical protein